MPTVTLSVSPDELDYGVRPLLNYEPRFDGIRFEIRDEGGQTPSFIITGPGVNEEALSLLNRAAEQVSERCKTRLTDYEVICSKRVAQKLLNASITEVRGESPAL